VLALKRNHLIAHEPIHDLDRFLEALYQLTARREIYAVHGVLGLVPTSAKTKLEASIRNVVDRDRLLSQERRMPKCIARDQHTNPDPARNCR
jgi:hypothetical protein